MDGISVGSEYAEHVTEADVRLLTAITGRPPRPDVLPGLLADPRVFDAIFGSAAAASGEAVLASPFLVFAVAVHRAAADLATARYVPERSLARQRVPVFDAPDLRDFLGSAARRLFLTELLNSFTRVASGRYRVSVGGRAKTRRFSELDPVRLAGLLDAAPEESRPGIYRRLGDVALFLSGVFPDYVAARAFGPVNAARLLRPRRCPRPSRHGWWPRPTSSCWSTSAPGGTGRRWPWPRCRPDGWPSWPRSLTGSARRDACSITLRTVI